MIGLSPLLYLYFAGSALILYVFQHILSVISGISDSLTCVRRALHSFTCGSLLIPRKEVIQPHLPIRLPCYDFTPIIAPTFDGWLLAVTSPASGVNDFRGVTGGVYKARERIHRSMLTCDY